MEPSRGRGSVFSAKFGEKNKNGRFGDPVRDRKAGIGYPAMKIEVSGTLHGSEQIGVSAENADLLGRHHQTKYPEPGLLVSRPVADK